MDAFVLIHNHQQNLTNLKMADITFQNEMQDAFGDYYPCNYPMAAAAQLKVILTKTYKNNRETFKQRFIIPTQMLLKNLKEQNVPLLVRDGNIVKIIVHLVMSEEVELGVSEFYYCVGQRSPGTLSLKFIKYVTQTNEGTAFGKGSYMVTKMTIEDNSYKECLTLDYLERLRSNGQMQGTERTSALYRECWVMILNGSPSDGFYKLVDDNTILRCSNKHMRFQKSATLPDPPLHAPYQVSEEASIRMQHPMEVGYSTNKSYSRQSALESIDDDAAVVASKLPINEWNVTVSDPNGMEPDPTGMGPEPTGVISDPTGMGPEPTGMSIDPTGMISDPTGGISDPTGMGPDYICSLKSNITGNSVQNVDFPSCGPQALLYIQNDIGSSVSGQPSSLPSSKLNRPAYDVNDGYVSEDEGVGPKASSNVSGQPSSLPSNKLNRPAYDVNDAYVSEDEGVGPKASSSVNGQPSSLPSSQLNRPAYDVNDGYVGESKGVGPKASSNVSGQPSSLPSSKLNRPAYDVNDGYVSEAKGVGPKVSSSVSGQPSSMPSGKLD